MVYKSSINARLRLEGDNLSTYERYSAQRMALLSKNEHGFADKKRTRGAMAQAYNEQTFRFEYPVFKTPEIPEDILIGTVFDKINDPEALISLIVYEYFFGRLGDIVQKFRREFEALDILAAEYRQQPDQTNRDKIEAEVKRLISRFTKVGEREIVLNTKLTELRANMYNELISSERTGNASPYPTSQPFYKVKGLYERSGFWKIFRKMPKMGLLHMHTSASVSPEWIINELVEDADNGHAKYGKAYVILGDDPKTRGKLTFEQPSGMPYDVLSRRLLYTDNDGRLGRELPDLLSFRSDRINSIDYIWDEFNTIFSKTGDLLDNPEFYLAYYTEAFKNLVDDNIEYLELRSGFSKFNGFAEDEFLRRLKQAEQNAQDYARAVGKQFRLRIILCGNRGKTRRADVIKKMIKAAKWAVSPEFNDLIIGFDMVSEEDRGTNTRYYAEFIINSQIYKLLNFYFHDGETNWDFNTNMIDAYLMSDRRIGHGFALNNYPQLMDNLAYMQKTPLHTPCEISSDLTGYFARLDELVNEVLSIDGLSDNEKYAMLSGEILKYTERHPVPSVISCIESDVRSMALEICPISNQMLRYTSDLRLHPANALLHKGVQCVLANDDPQILGNTGLTYDFISAFLAWDLDLWQIKQLIVNSIVYSAIPRKKDFSGNCYDDIITALNRFNVLWHNFLIEEIRDIPDIPAEAAVSGYEKMTCDRDYFLSERITAVDQRYVDYIDG